MGNRTPAVQAVFSPSSLRCFETCPKQYHFRYVEKRRVDVEGRGRGDAPACLVMDGASHTLADGLGVTSSPAAARGARRTPAGG